MKNTKNILNAGIKIVCNASALKTARAGLSQGE